MKFFLGKKLKMSQIFHEDGQVEPVTIVSALPVTVTALKTKDRDGYQAVQLAWGEKPSRGAKEFRQSTDANELKVGDQVTLSTFAVGDQVAVSGISKGRGFQGVVKRHGFKGGPRTHGQKHSEREPGSIGGGLRTRVPKGMRMAGRMGGDRVTVANLKVVRVDEAGGRLYLSGAVPGRKGTVVEVRSGRES